MSGATRVLRPRPVRDVKSDANVTPIHVRKNRAVLAEEIRHGWKETLEGIVQTGVLLIEGRFRKADYQHYGLPFSYSWGKRLIKIASSQRILNPLNRSVLPDKADSLHQIVLMTDKLFDLAVKENVVNPSCLTVDIKSFRQSFVEPGRCRRRRLTVVYDCSPDRDESAPWKCSVRSSARSRSWRRLGSQQSMCDVRGR